MIHVILNGCGGAMGRVITDMAAADDTIEIVAGVDVNTDLRVGYPVYHTLQECPTADVIIDFSVAKATDGVLSYCEETKTPLVLIQRDFLKNSLPVWNVLANPVLCFGLPICLWESIFC